MIISETNSMQTSYRFTDKIQRTNNRCAEQMNATFDDSVLNVGKGHTVYMMTPERLYSGGNGTGLSFCIEYAGDTSEDDPTVIARGVDENGQEFEQTIHINDINPRNASLVEMRALEAHYQVNKGMGLSSFPHGIGDMGLHDRRDFISLFEKNIEDMQNVGRYDLSLFYTQNKNTYLDLIGKTDEQIDSSRFAPNEPKEVKQTLQVAGQMHGNGDGKNIGVMAIGNQAYLAQYSENSTPENPIVKVGDYEISVNDVDPRNATEIEMFALMSHLDKTGQSRNEGMSSFSKMRTYSQQAEHNGFCSGIADAVEAWNSKRDWSEIIENARKTYSQSLIPEIYALTSKCAHLLNVMQKWIENRKFVGKPEILDDEMV